MGYDGAGSLYALGARFTKLNPDGSPLVGPGNAYTVKNLVQAEVGLTYNTPDAVSQLNGSGSVCFSAQAAPSLEGGTLSGLRFCAPDPNLISFLIGGRVYEDDATPTPNQIGYGAPQVGTNPVPNGVSVELFSQAMIGSGVASVLPYIHWVLPRAKLQPAGNLALTNSAYVLPEFTGTLEENANWGDGPVGDFDYESDRVWQYVRVAAIPDLTAGLVAVVADA
jgi:hypothetical protein